LELHAVFLLLGPKKIIPQHSQIWAAKCCDPTNPFHPAGTASPKGAILEPSAANCTICSLGRGWGAATMMSSRTAYCWVYVSNIVQTIVVVELLLGSILGYNYLKLEVEPIILRTPKTLSITAQRPPDPLLPEMRRGRQDLSVAPRVVGAMSAVVPGVSLKPSEDWSVPTARWDSHSPAGEIPGAHGDVLDLNK
jgi:hypothetical protein